MPMFSFTLVQKIEANAAHIVSQIAEEIRSDHRLVATHVLGDDRIIRQARHLTENFGHWLVARDAEIQDQMEPLGRARFDDSVPLHELILCLQSVERKIIDFARESTTGTVLQIYADEELQYRVNRLFDNVIYFAARGYESALTEVVSVQARMAHGATQSATGR